MRRGRYKPVAQNYPTGPMRPASIERLGATGLIQGSRPQKANRRLGEVHDQGIKKLTFPVPRDAGHAGLGYRVSEPIPSHFG